MSTDNILEIHHPQATRTLAPEELNARRSRKAFTTPLDPPHTALEPARTGRRVFTGPAPLPSQQQR